MSHVTEEHRQGVAEGRRVEVGGYTAVSDADLDRIEVKLKGKPAGKPKSGKASSKADTPEGDGLDKLGDDELKALAAKEDVEIPEDATSAKIVAAIRKKRKDDAAT